MTSFEIAFSREISHFSEIGHIGSPPVYEDGTREHEHLFVNLGVFQGKIAFFISTYCLVCYSIDVQYVFCLLGRFITGFGWKYSSG